MSRLKTQLRALIVVALALGVLAPAAAAAGSAKARSALQMTPVGRLPFPERGYVIDLPKGAAVAKGRVRVSENGIGIGEFSLDALSSSGVSYGTVLAVDASDSMSGRPEAGALAAANDFVSKRAPNQEIGLIAFNGKVTVVQEPTIDAAQLHSALARVPSLSYGTHLYDAVQKSLALLASNKISAGSIVLISDGSDIGSATSLERAITAALKQHVRVFTVGLRSGAFDGPTLRKLASETGGSYAETSSAEGLSPIFSQLGTKLAREYLLTYRSLAAPSSIVDVSVSLDGIGKSTTRYTAPTPSQLPPYHRPFFRRFILSGWSFFLLVLLVIGLVAVAVRLALDAARSRFIDRVRAFAGKGDGEEEPKKEVEDWRRRAARVKTSGSAAARGWLGRLEEQLDIGRIRLSSRWIVAGTAAATFLVIILLGAVSPIFAVLGLGTPLITRAWIRWKVKRVRDAFAEQLPPNLQVLASGLRAGFTLLGALVASVENAHEPSQSELGRAIADEQLGVPLEDAIRRVADRMASRDLEQVAMLAELVRTTGGNAAEVLDIVVLAVRERQDLRRLVRTLTAQGRMARWILTFLPIGTGLAFWAIQPEIVGSTWKTGTGQVFLVIAAIMVASGSYLIQKIIEVEV